MVFGSAFSAVAVAANERSAATKTFRIFRDGFTAHLSPFGSMLMLQPDAQNDADEAADFRIRMLFILGLEDDAAVRASFHAAEPVGRRSRRRPLLFFERLLQHCGSCRSADGGQGFAGRYTGRITACERLAEKHDDVLTAAVCKTYADAVDDPGIFLLDEKILHPLHRLGIRCCTSA